MKKKETKTLFCGLLLRCFSSSFALFQFRKLSCYNLISLSTMLLVTSLSLNHTLGRFLSFSRYSLTFWFCISNTHQFHSIYRKYNNGRENETQRKRERELISLKNFKIKTDDLEPYAMCNTQSFPFIGGVRHSFDRFENWINQWVAINCKCDTIYCNLMVNSKTTSYKCHVEKAGIDEYLPTLWRFVFIFVFANLNIANKMCAGETAHTTIYV